MSSINTNNMQNAINNVNIDESDFPWWVNADQAVAVRPSTASNATPVRRQAITAPRRQAIANLTLQRHAIATSAIDACRRQMVPPPGPRDDRVRRAALAVAIARARQVAAVAGIRARGAAARGTPAQAPDTSNAARDARFKALVTMLFNQVAFLRATVATADRRLLAMRGAHIVLIQGYLQEIKMHMLALKAGHVIVRAAIAKRRAELAAQARRAQRARSSAPPPRDI